MTRPAQPPPNVTTTTTVPAGTNLPDLSTDAGWFQFVQQHGGYAGSPRPIYPVDKYGNPQEDPDAPVEYLLADGTVIDINRKGQVSKLDQSMTKQPDTTHPNQTDQDGTVYIWDAKGGPTGTGGYIPAPGLPQGVPKPKENDTRKNVQNGYSVQEIYKGGQWVIDPSVNPTPFTPEAQAAATKAGAQPKENDTRQNVSNGYAVQEVYKGGSWVTDPSVKPVPFDPATAAKPKENDVRSNVQNGYSVQEVYRGGQWVIDPTKPPVPFTPEAQAAAQKAGSQPKENDKRSNVQNGYNVQEIYKGGQWVIDPTIPPTPYTPEAAAAAAKATSQPKENDTRRNVQSGYTVQEVYKGGQWVVDPTVAPVQFTPDKPTVVSAPNNQLNIATLQNGQIGTQQNPNFIPTTTAEVAARTAQLDQLARAKRDDLMAKQQSGALTADQVQSQWQQWWSSTIEPQKTALDAAQRAAATAEQQKAQEAQRAALATAQTGAGEILRAVQADHPNSPEYAAALGAVLKGTRGAPQGVDYAAALSGQGPNYQDIYEKATAQMLQHISPTAAQISTGQPVPTALPQLQSANPSQVLSQSNYFPGGGGPPPGGPPPGGGQPAAAAPATPAVPATAPPQTDWVAMMARLNQDKADQARQARVGPVQPPTPGLYNPYYQQGSAAGQPAIGPVAGGGSGGWGDWSWPPYQPAF